MLLRCVAVAVVVVVVVVVVGGGGVGVGVGLCYRLFWVGACRVRVLSGLASDSRLCT